MDKTTKDRIHEKLKCVGFDIVGIAHLKERCSEFEVSGEKDLLHNLKGFKILTLPIKNGHSLIEMGSTKYSIRDASVIFSDGTVIIASFESVFGCKFYVKGEGDMFIENKQVACDNKNVHSDKIIMDSRVEWVLFAFDINPTYEEQSSSLEDYKNATEVACELKTDNTHPCKGGFPKKSSIPIISSGGPNWFNGFSKSFKKK